MLPTKSGIIGLLAAAMGRRRTDPIEDLVGIRFGVREEQAGKLTRDFHTAVDWRTGKSLPLSQRYYVSDAKYLAVVEGDQALVEGLHNAILSPVFPLYLGRRSCPPSGRIVLGIVDDSVENVLETADWRASDWYRKNQPQQVNLLWSRDARPDERHDESVRDAPVSFDPRHRQYGLRDVRHGWTQVSNPEGRHSPVHDEFLLLGGEG